jgi:ribose 5-phosphate isomerase RpiB
MLRPTGGSVIHDHFSAEQGVADDHMSVICIRGRTVGPGVAWDLVQTWWLASSAKPRDVCAA